MKVSQCKINQAYNRGFTLVELLVVIAIIALLLSILMPSLNKARNQAKLLVCQTRARQIGTLVEMYQSDNDRYVPILYNQYFVVPRAAFMSTGFTAYFPIKLPADQSLDPTVPWGTEEYDTYIKNFMPKFFCCPFATGTNSTPKFTQVADIKDYGGRFAGWSRSGRCDSYVTWMWKGFFYPTRAQSYSVYPIGPPNGWPQYEVLNWHSAEGQVANSSFPTSNWTTLKKYPTKWSASKKIFGETTISYCSQGQYDSFQVGGGGIVNYKSHEKGGKGGSNVLFADGHVGWVEGTRVGW